MIIDRPKIKIKLTTADKLFELAGWILIVAIWILIIATYNSLPDSIPKHFNALGTADSFGKKDSIFILPIIASVIFIGLTILNKFPHLFNYPVKVTNENAVRLYTIATKLIRSLKLIIVVVFGSLVVQIVRNSYGHANGLGVWFLPVTLSLVFITLIYGIMQFFKAK